MFVLFFSFFFFLFFYTQLFLCMYLSQTCLYMFNDNKVIIIKLKIYFISIFFKKMLFNAVF
jgi:hypothetical protein